MSSPRPNPGRPARLEMLVSNDDLAAATLGNVFFSAMWKRGTAETMRDLRRWNDALLVRHPKGTVTFNLVGPGSLVPDADARAEAAKALEAYGDRHLASATVLLGEGFWASTMRSVITAIFFMSSQRTPRRMFDDVTSAASWIVTLAGDESPTPEAIAEAATRLLALAPPDAR